MLVSEAVGRSDANHQWEKWDGMRFETSPNGTSHPTMYQCKRCFSIGFEDHEDSGPCRVDFQLPADAEHVTITKLAMTCRCVPSQWEGLTDDDRVVYIRYRGGYGRIGIGNTLHDAIMNEPPLFYWYGDEPLDGYISFEDLKEKLPPHIVFAEGITGGFDDDVTELVSEISAEREVLQSVPEDEVGG